MSDDVNKSSKFVKQFAANRGNNFTEKYKNPNALSNKAEKFSDKLQKENQDNKHVPFSNSQSVLRKSKLINKNFTESTKKSRIDCLFLVRGKDNGKAAWHYVLVDKHKREMFLAKSRSGSIDVALYGQILYSGWGDDPPQDIVKKIEDEFGA